MISCHPVLSRTRVRRSMLRLESCVGWRLRRLTGFGSGGNEFDAAAEAGEEGKGTDELGAGWGMSSSELSSADCGSSCPPRSGSPSTTWIGNSSSSEEFSKSSGAGGWGGRGGGGKGCGADAERERKKERKEL